MTGIERGIRAIDAYTLPARRRVAAGVVGKILPYEKDGERTFLEQQAEQTRKIGEHLAQRRGMAGVPLHWSNGDFVRLLVHQFQQSREIRTLPILIPIAEHQRHVVGLDGISGFTNVNLLTIVTADTKRKEEKLRAAGKKIPWEEHEEGYGTKEYIEKAIQFLKDGNVVLLSPQGARYAKMEPFQERAIGLLIAYARRKGLTDFGFFFMSLGIHNATDYSQLRGYNPLRPYQITYNEVLTRNELVLQAKGNDRTVDEEAYMIMRKNAPEGMVSTS